jgi:hypothetical protein
MDIEAARRDNASWLQITDWQILAMRAAGLAFDGSRTRPNIAAGNVPQHLPPLDWPLNLFEDEPLWH